MSDGAVEPHTALRQRVRDLCAEFPELYWRDLDGWRAYPEEFVAAMTHARLLAALIPHEFGKRVLGQRVLGMPKSS